MEARTSDVGHEVAQSWARGWKDKLNGGQPMEVHLAAHLWAAQWLRGGWPTVALWRAASAVFGWIPRDIAPNIIWINITLIGTIYDKLSRAPSRSTNCERGSNEFDVYWRAWFLHRFARLIVKFILELICTAYTLMS